MDVKRSKKIHIIVQEEPKRKAPKIPVVKPKTEDPFFRKIIAKVTKQQKEEQLAIDLLESVKESLKNKLSPESYNKILNEEKNFSPEKQTEFVKIPTYDEIMKYGEPEENVPEESLTYEKLKETVEMFKTTNAVVTKGRQTGKNHMIFAYDLETNTDWGLTTSTGRTTGRIKKGEMVAKAEAKLENARNNPPNYWVTGDGRRIPIAEMTDDHLINTIRYIFKKVDYNPRIVIQDAYQQLVGQQPWVSKQIYTERLTEFENDGFCQDVFKRFPKLQTLIREAAFRGLSLIKGDGQYSK